MYHVSSKYVRILVQVYIYVHHEFRSHRESNARKQNENAQRGSGFIRSKRGDEQNQGVEGGRQQSKPAMLFTATTWARLQASIC